MRNRFTVTILSCTNTIWNINIDSSYEKLDDKITHYTVSDLYLK